jgi:hypothetical protein
MGTETETQMQQRVSDEGKTETSDTAAPLEVWVNDSGAAHSKENILQWLSYLPEDCIQTMIAMGWDVTT